MGILFENVTYAYQAGSLLERIALESVSLHIKQGRFVAVVGAAGSGKSTLLQHMNGIALPTKGALRILDFEIKAGEPLQHPRRLRKRVGLVFQFPEQQLFAETVEDDLCFGPLNFGFSKEEARHAAIQALEMMGLDESILTRHPYELSGGQMRKVAIASILASDPDIFVLDEPTASLDPASQVELIRLLDKLCHEYGKTIIIVTHRLDDVYAFVDEWIVMHEGKAVFHGQLEELVSSESIVVNKGLVLPAAIRFMKEFCERFGAEWPGKLDNIEETADYISSWLSEKQREQTGAGGI